MSTGGRTRIDAELEPPFSDAVSTAVWLVDTEVAAAVKVALVAPAAAVTEAGTLTAPLFELRVTAPVDAAAERFTTQLVVPPLVNEAAPQTRLETTGAGEGEVTVRVAPVADAARELPVASVAETLAKDKAAVADAVTETFATTPLAMVLVFCPYSTHE